MVYDVIMAILQRGKADQVMDAAKRAGAKGGTIFLARGTGEHEAKTFFGLTIETGREILLILTKSEQTESILNAIIEAGKLKEPGTGVAFVFHASQIVGLDHRQGIESSEQ
jgi:nitrogen regulatory protein P-II 1